MVTMGGDSAGAASVTMHLTAYGGSNDHLFQAAAAESDSFATQLTVNESQYQYDLFVTRLGCANFVNTLSCLRNKTAAEMQAQNFNTPYPGAENPPLYMWNPTIDDDLIRDYTYRAFTQGKFIHVPSIFGDDTNGGTVFAPRHTNTTGDSSTFLHDQFPYLTLSQLRHINTLYPITSPTNNLTFPNSGPYWRQLSNAYGDMRYLCPGLSISTSLSRHHVPKNWNYQYNVADPAQIAQGLGVPHTVEVNAIWGPENVNGGAPLSYYPNGTNADVPAIMQGYWTSFVRAHDPNTYRLPGTPRWEKWTERGMRRLWIEGDGATRMERTSQYYRERCAFFNGIGVSVRQ